MDAMQENRERLAALTKEVSSAELLINAEIGKAARENREIDPKLLDAIDKVDKTKKVIESLSATLESMNGLFVREVDSK